MKVGVSIQITISPVREIYTNIPTWVALRCIRDLHVTYKAIVGFVLYSYS